MGILAEQLGNVLAVLDEHAPADLDVRIRAGVVAAHELAAGLDPYLERCAGEESAALRALAEETRTTDWAASSPVGEGPALEQEMLSGHVEGRLLQLLVRITGAQDVLEIGMFTGYSALALAEALPPDGTVVACEIDERAAAVAQRHFDASSVGQRVDVRLGRAVDTLWALAEEGRRFDLVFLDADKAGYLDYLELLLERDLLRARGLVVVDNTLLQGQPWTTATPTGPGAAIAAFNEAVRVDPRLDQVLLPLRDGVTLIRRRVD